MHEYIKNYMALQSETLGKLPYGKINEIILLFKQALDQDQQLFVFGNGGSAANASHFVTDLGKGASDKTYKRFRCLSLNDNTNWMTAISNDYSYDEVFVRQLMNLARPGDLVLVMSVSGNSPNLVKALEWSAQNGIYSIAFVGDKKGRLAEIADMVLVVSDTHYGRVEDAQMTICHIIAYAFMEIAELQMPPGLPPVHRGGD
ncbi:MAG: SIS domain-containing protein [Ferruginibacter sp.]